MKRERLCRMFFNSRLIDGGGADYRGVAEGATNAPFLSHLVGCSVLENRNYNGIKRGNILIYSINEMG